MLHRSGTCNAGCLDAGICSQVSSVCFNPVTSCNVPMAPRLVSVAKELFFQDLEDRPEGQALKRKAEQEGGNATKVSKRVVELKLAAWLSSSPDEREQYMRRAKNPSARLAGSAQLKESSYAQESQETKLDTQDTCSEPGVSVANPVPDDTQPATNSQLRDLGREPSAHATLLAKPWHDDIHSWEDVMCEGLRLQSPHIVLIAWESLIELGVQFDPPFLELVLEWTGYVGRIKQFRMPSPERTALRPGRTPSCHEAANEDSARHELDALRDASTPKANPGNREILGVPTLPHAQDLSSIALQEVLQPSSQANVSHAQRFEPIWSADQGFEAQTAASNFMSAIKKSFQGQAARSLKFASSTTVQSALQVACRLQYFHGTKSPPIPVEMLSAPGKWKPPQHEVYVTTHGNENVVVYHVHFPATGKKSHASVQIATNKVTGGRCKVTLQGTRRVLEPFAVNWVMTLGPLHPVAAQSEHAKVMEFL